MRQDLSLRLATPEEEASRLIVVPSEAELADIAGAHRSYLKALRDVYHLDQALIIPQNDGLFQAVFVCPPDQKLFPETFGALAQSLPPGAWKIDVERCDTALRAAIRENAFIGFCLGAFQTARAAPANAVSRIVLEAELRSCVPYVEAIWLARDLINAAPNLLGPAELAAESLDVLSPLGADVNILAGEILSSNYPCLYAVGAGATEARAPKVVIAHWTSPNAGPGAPLISLVGKGVCFDTGGLDIKPSGAMRRMKKDMGGAALMLALATMIIKSNLPVRLELRLGCVENCVSGAAMRPGDVLQTRAGLRVEVDNTDAEGRLVLSDLLTEACEASPDYLIDAATLTGAARVALGPDLPALFGNNDSFCEAILSAAQDAGDPVWRLPLWHGYNAWLSSEIADLSNASSVPMAGAVTAALFLERFVKNDVKWAHIDTYAWNDVAKPGHPSGGDARSLRALYGALKSICNQ